MTLERQMADALIETYKEFERSRISAPWVKYGLGERRGFVRLTVDDVARICARVAREAETTAGGG